MSFHIETIPNRRGRDTILLREAWREGAKVRKRTIANLTYLPPAVTDGFRAVLRGGIVLGSPDEVFGIRRSLPHGHAAAALGTMRSLGFEGILGRKKSRMRGLAMAAAAARIIDPASKLATARALDPETASTSLGELPGLGPVSGNEMLDMLDWLLERQPWIERSLANRHLRDGTLVLYDVSSSYVEGRKCPLAAFGHSRDGKKGKMQITYGLVCSGDGTPVAVEVFSGNTADPDTVRGRAEKLRRRFRVENIALVGDRGMITSARIREDLIPLGLDWISALRSADIRKLVKKGKDAPAALDPARLAEDQVAETVSPDFPGERLLVCLNPRLREERARKREDLLRATEQTLAEIAAAASRRRPGPKNREMTAKALGRRGNRKKVEKHFNIEIRDGGMDWSRDAAKTAAEAALDGIHVVRTSLGKESIGGEAAVAAYKSLALVERAFRTMKTSGLRVRPFHVYNEGRVKAHVFLCMLAWHVERSMREKLAPILFEDDDREAARARRSTPVEKAEVSESAKAKAASKQTPDGLPVHSFRTLLADLGTLTLNDAFLPGRPGSAFRMAARPTALQKRAFELLEIKPPGNVVSSMTG